MRKLSFFLGPLVFCLLQKGIEGQFSDLEILDSQGTKAHDRHPHTGIELAYDKVVSSERQHCYLSHRGSLAEGPPVALFFIDKAVVDAVMILNRDDGYYWQQNGMFVSVCDTTTQACELCGEVSDAQQGSWVTIQCSGKIGDAIEVSHTQDLMALDICEINVKGQELVEEEEVVGGNVVDTESVPVDQGISLGKGSTTVIESQNKNGGEKKTKGKMNLVEKVKKGAKDAAKTVKNAAKKATKNTAKNRRKAAREAEKRAREAEKKARKAKKKAEKAKKKAERKARKEAKKARKKAEKAKKKSKKGKNKLRKFFG